ncbi:MAG: GNAT family N-acetyltransferase [Rhodospirillales bacterium]|nr:GNAT family N-acetyltransferase [Alphaproteobacteria bacterium]MBL6947803.1 GNAT family N-acetyltransferase [Rhodospirillales bacterium]
MPIIIRDLTAADEPRWRELWQGYLTFYETDVSPAVTDATWNRLLASNEMFCLVAEGENGTIQGIVNCVLHLNTWTEKPVCYLEDLFVDPAARNNGAGRALIEAVRERGQADNWHRIYWRTHKNNATARALYDTLADGTDWFTYEISL